MPELVLYFDKNDLRTNIYFAFMMGMIRENEYLSYVSSENNSSMKVFCFEGERSENGLSCVLDHYDR